MQEQISGIETALIVAKVKDRANWIVGDVEGVPVSLPSPARLASALSPTKNTVYRSLGGNFISRVIALVITTRAHYSNCSSLIRYILLNRSVH